MPFLKIVVTILPFSECIQVFECFLIIASVLSIIHFIINE